VNTTESGTESNCGGNEFFNSLLRHWKGSFGGQKSDLDFVAISFGFVVSDLDFVAAGWDFVAAGLEFIARPRPLKRKPPVD
jgi:hypothetical protein